MMWIDDVAVATTGVAIGAIVQSSIADQVPRNQRVLVFVLLAAAGIVYLSWKHQREAES